VTAPPLLGDEKLADVSARRRRWWLAPVIGLAAVVAIVVVAWIVDTMRYQGKVQRNVELSGVQVGGQARNRIQSTVDDLADSFAATKVVVHAGSATFTGTAGEMGLTVDRPATVAQALVARRTGNPLNRFVDWIESFGTQDRTGVALQVVPEKVSAWVTSINDKAKTQAAEPRIVTENGKLTVKPGNTGIGIDGSAVTAQLEELDYSGGTIEVSVAPQTFAPQHSVADAQSLIDQAVSVTANPVTVRAGTATTTLQSDQLRRWLVGRSSGASITVGFDPALVVNDLKPLLASGATPAQNASMTLVGNTPTIIPGQEGSACCDPSAADVILKALQSHTTGVVTLPMVPVDPPITSKLLQSYGITTQVSSFTTHHPCCAARVQNIHHVADIMRGYIIPPGQTLSMNQVLGPRTTAKGYVMAPAIADGVDTEQIGGGISQFMTTIFNAAFFAGLDYGQYQSHSIYISRYPYGREATIGYPAPQLEIKNTTPYGIMVWTGYTGTSLTVTFYSTPYFSSVTQSAQTKAPSGLSCTKVSTQRTRVYLDGHTSVDYVYATYRVSEGIDCSQPPNATPRSTPRT
jgi:vancomycin resistance protein YoaR